MTKMSSPTVVRVNTLIQRKEQPYVDPLSNCYFILQTTVGLNRLPLIVTNYVYIYFPITMLYSLFIIIILPYSIASQKSLNGIGSLMMNFSEFTFCVVFGIATWKRIQLFYMELTRFDVEVGCRPKVSNESTRNLVQNIFTISFICIFYLLSFYIQNVHILWLELIPMHILHSLELHYYGHLLSLLTTRLCLINYYTESSFSHVKISKQPKVEEFIYFKYKNVINSEMQKLMDLYNTIIKAYEYLVAAIKWQLLVIIVASFISILWLGYHYALSIIKSKDILGHVVLGIGLIIIKLLPLFSPCMMGDRLHSEVRILRELLASKLYENKLDKSSRSTARALLALTEARDLSFSLLRMVEIDISFPFKFLGLLITYLIILLQFEKVINP